MTDEPKILPGFFGDEAGLGSGKGELISGEEKTEIIVDPEMLSHIITELMRPVMQTIGKMLENNTAALEQLSAAQSIQNDRLEALEKQIRLQTPVTSKQVTYLNDAIRQRARALLYKKGIEDRKAATKLGGMIRKAVLSRHGIGNIREIPRHEYSVDMSYIEAWNDVLAVHDVAKEAKARMERDENQNGADRTNRKGTEETRDTDGRGY